MLQKMQGMVLDNLDLSMVKINVLVEMGWCSGETTHLRPLCTNSAKNFHDLTYHSYIPLGILANEFFISSLLNFDQSPDESLQIEAENLRNLFYACNILEVL